MQSWADVPAGGSPRCLGVRGAAGSFRGFRALGGTRHGALASDAFTPDHLFVQTGVGSTMQTRRAKPLLVFPRIWRSVRCQGPGQSHSPENAPSHKASSPTVAGEPFGGRGAGTCPARSVVSHGASQARLCSERGDLGPAGLGMAALKEKPETDFLLRNNARTMKSAVSTAGEPVQGAACTSVAVMPGASLTLQEGGREPLPETQEPPRPPLPPRPPAPCAALARGW